jgi:hypothetical protein
MGNARKILAQLSTILYPCRHYGVILKYSELLSRPSTKRPTVSDYSDSDQDTAAPLTARHPTYALPFLALPY